MVHLLSLLAAALASIDPIFTPVNGVPPAHPSSVAGPRPAAGTLVRTDVEALRAALLAAPDHQPEIPLAQSGIIIELPNPSGEPVACFVSRSPVMAPELQALFPQIQTYLVQSTDGTATGRFEVTQRGLTAKLRTPDGTWMIDLWQSADPNHIITYWMHDLQGTTDMVCETTPGVHGHASTVPDPDPNAEPNTPGGFGERALQSLRNVRLAAACTGEFGLYHSTIQGHEPNVADPLAAIVTMVARTNVVYEQDVAVHFNLVANNELIIFTDPATDPYDASCGGGGGADCSGPLLGANITLLRNVIGDENFDVGEVLTRIFGGVAYLSAVCGPNKAGGVSGMPRGGDIDPFAANVLIHELGHQFGANHTFSGTRGRCFGNVSLGTAWEAGSGSSPMAYAGGCPVGDAPPTDNVVQFADPFFHHGSIREIQNFLGTSNANCLVPVVTANNQPVIVSTTGSTAIPPSTPFTLTAVATDQDNDTLTYSWEQFNSGVARPLTGEEATDNGSGSLFRIFPPVFSPSRTFPQMSDVLSGIATPGERLPTVTNVTRRFRVIVRDNRPGAGAVAVSAFVNLDIAGSPFTVLTPAADQRVASGPFTVTWTVGGTSSAPVNCPTVAISLSTDGGNTFNVPLGNFPNNGAALVTIPALPPGEAFIKVSGAGRIFFNVSREFLINVPCTSDIDHDGDVDSDDIIGFFDSFELGDSDIDGDDDTDSDDIILFFAGFESGCGQ